MKEMQWFIKAAEPFKGMDINVVSETITTHEYESGTLAKAFTEITGIAIFFFFFCFRPSFRLVLFTRIEVRSPSAGSTNHISRTTRSSRRTRSPS